MNSTEVGVTIFPFLQEKKGYKERDMEGWKLVSPKSKEQIKKVEREYRITEMRSKKECGKWTDWELDEPGFHFRKTFQRLLIKKTIISQFVKKIVMLLKCSPENVSIHSAKESRKCFLHKGQGSTDLYHAQIWQYLNSGKVRSNIL